jgi:hypothetical protein
MTYITSYSVRSTKPGKGLPHTIFPPHMLNYMPIHQSPPGMARQPGNLWKHKLFVISPFTPCHRQGRHRLPDSHHPPHMQDDMPIRGQTACTNRTTPLHHAATRDATTC